MARANPDAPKLNPQLLAVCRTVHIYLTMLGLFVMLLFSVTGLTINHEIALGAATARPTQRESEVAAQLVAARDHSRIVENLRETFGIRGAMTNFSEFDDELAIAFKSPGEVWDITIAKPSGKVTARSERYSFVAILNNLHRGRYTGPAWGWIIDFSAGLIVLACVTGFILWLALPRRRQWGIAWLVLGTFATMAVIYLFVPGADIPILP
jgi:hypothetical protein